MLRTGMMNDEWRMRNDRNPIILHSQFSIRHSSAGRWRVTACLLKNEPVSSCVLLVEGLRAQGRGKPSLNGRSRFASLAQSTVFSHQSLGLPND